MIDDVFGAGGLLAGKLTGYAPRKGQVDMAKAVASALERRRHLVVEGPTGTGKTVAYLVPSIAKIAAMKKAGDAMTARVIVVTANIALQEQLVGKDLPLLASVLPEPFRFALSKGKNNYLCQDALGKALGEGLLARDPMFERMLQWAQGTETGDVSEFPEQMKAADWRRVSVSSDECKGTACKQFTTCFAEKAKRAVSQADVVVTNYHLFFAHLKVREKMREIRERGGTVDLDIVLPPASVVIFDEAHKAADVARDFLGFQVTKGQVDWLVRGFNHALAAQARQEAESYFAAAMAHKKSRGYRARLKKDHPVDGEPLARVLDAVAAVYKQAVGAGAWSPDERAELEIRARRGATIAAQVRQATKPELFPEAVFFLEETERGAAVIRSRPIDVAPWLKRELFSEFDSVVLTSATLATGENSFAYVRKEVGLDGEDCGELVAESPFEFSKNVLMVVPKTMTGTDDREGFPGAVAQHVVDACEAARGRTLGLFTSYRNLDAAHERLSRVRRDYRVLKHGEAPRTRLMREFREDVSSVLLGTESFWAGVDVPGESLSCVVIDRLPFPNPDDPIFDALAEKDRNAFFSYAVPRAIIQFKQGFGRLIRTTTDRGCVVVLDRRIIEKGYGRAFIKALPRTMMGDEIEDVGKFLDMEPA